MPTKLKSTGVEFPDGTTQTTKAEGDIPSGTRMLFYQASAPTGWSQVTSVNDKVLRVVDSGGGTTGGSWTISGLSVDGHSLSESELPSHSHDFSGSGNTSSDGSHSHTGSTNTTGSHRHSILRTSGTEFTEFDQVSNKKFGNGVSFSSSGPDGNWISLSGNHSHSLSINSNGSHSHSFSVSGDTGNTGGNNSHSHGISHNGSWRPAYADVIICERD